MGKFYTSKVVLSVLVLLTLEECEAAHATIGLYTTQSPAFQAPTVLSETSNNAVSLLAPANHTTPLKEWVEGWGGGILLAGCRWICRCCGGTRSEQNTEKRGYLSERWLLIWWEEGGGGLTSL